MTIRIKGLIAGIEVDLSIDGLDSDSLSKIVSGISQPVANKKAEVSQQNAPFGSDESQQAWQLARALIKDQGEVLSCDLVNYLNNKGFSDRAIKKALLLLREQGEVATCLSKDGQQRVYRQHP